MTLPLLLWTAWNLQTEGADGFELQLLVVAVLPSALSTDLTCLSKRRVHVSGQQKVCVREQTG